ncbi:hypothetical protein PG990_002786 [Apiospora arundinis]
MERNKATSPLYRLPDELVLGICRAGLEGSDVYIARQSCSVLRRILSSDEFVSPMLTWRRPLTREPPIMQIPNIGVDWEDVHERLRRRGCCSACIAARVPKRDGSASDYDATMPRLASETKFCTACRASHPLIMFSQKQRSLEPTAVCIMAEGSVTLCPHHHVSLKALEMHRRVIRSSGRSQEPHPSVLHCKQCFQDMKEPGRATAIKQQPSARYDPLGGFISPYIGYVFPDMRRGTLFLDWIMPLQQVASATVATDSWNTSQYTTGNPAAQETLKDALAVAAKTYNRLLCPHVSFDEISPPQDSFWDARIGSRIARQDQAQDFKIEEAILGQQPGHACRACWSPRFTYKILGGEKPAPEYHWLLSRHGVSLRQQRQLPVPDLLGHQFSDAHQVWRQMLNPATYGLPEDPELRHLTWCPDAQCANGRNWASHQRHLDIIAAHFAIARLRATSPTLPRMPSCTPPIAERGIDKETVSQRRVIREMNKPHVFRGLKFLYATSCAIGAD